MPPSINTYIRRRSGSTCGVTPRHEGEGRPIPVYCGYARPTARNVVARGILGRAVPSGVRETYRTALESHALAGGNGVQFTTYLSHSQSIRTSCK